MMPIYIPSRSRFDKSWTLENLATGGLLPVVEGGRPVYLVPPAEQAKQYTPISQRYGVPLLPCPAKGIARTRLFCGQHAQSIGAEKFIMLDDDLRFFWRRGAEDTRLVQMRTTPKVYAKMFNVVEQALSHYAHVAISARGGNNTLGYPYVENKRPLRALAYRTKEFLRVKHGRVAIMEDFDVTLQLMKLGFANCVITKYAQDHFSTQLPGGCSDYRSHELHARNVLKMERLHRPFITVKEKMNRTGGEFGKRIDATIYWQKAWKSSQGPNPLE